MRIKFNGNFASSSMTFKLLHTQFQCFRILMKCAKSLTVVVMHRADLSFHFCKLIFLPAPLDASLIPSHSCVINFYARKMQMEWKRCWWCRTDDARMRRQQQWDRSAKCDGKWINFKLTMFFSFLIFFIFPSSRPRSWAVSKSPLGLLAVSC